MTRAGFSVLEVVLALAVFGLATVMLSQAFTNTLIAVDRVSIQADESAMYRFVRSQIIRERNREAFEEGGEIETLLNGTARWHGEVEEMPVVDLFKVRLHVEIPAGEFGEVETWNEEIYLLRPTWSDPVDRSEILAENSERLLEERFTKDWAR